MREFSSFEDLGQKLQEIRSGREISLAEAARNLNMRENFLAAIEEGNLSVFPAPVYARGFIRNYLDFLGARDLWESYDLVFSLQGQQDVVVISPVVESPCLPVSQGFKRLTRRWLYAAVGALVVVGAFFVWAQRDLIRENISRGLPGQGDPQIVVRSTQPVESGALSIEVAKVSPSPSEMAVAAVSADGAASSSPDAAGTASPDLPWIEAMRESVDAPSEEGELVLRMSRACWIQVVHEKEVLFQGTVEEGAEKRFKLVGEIRVRMGRSSAVTAEWGGTEKTFKKPGGSLTVFFRPDGTLREQ